MMINNQPPVSEVETLDAYGRKKILKVTGEFPLTVYLNRHEVVTLMTLGVDAENLAVGYLVNQGWLTKPEELEEVQLDWSVNAVVVTTKNRENYERPEMGKRTVTTGCGQGTMYGDLMEKIDKISFANQPVYQSQIYRMLSLLTDENTIYRESGAVHGCALCEAGEQEKILHFVEDVGRHNAADSIAGKMWLNGVSGENKWFYTTGRLTSEMVIKAAQMGIPVLLSRSGITHMGLSMAQKINMTLIARAKGKFFIVYNGKDNIVLDAVQHDATDAATGGSVNVPDNSHPGKLKRERDSL